jgi:5S rRNA maturation endonuclease (ribonuclease M5)
MPGAEGRMTLLCIDVARAAGLGPGIRRGKETAFNCPIHDDHDPSLEINEDKNGWTCRVCGVSGNAWALAAFITGVKPDDKSAVAAWLREHNLLNSNGHHAGQIVDTYDYQLADGNLSYQALRYDPKYFSARRPDGKGGWIDDVKGLKRLPYHLPELLRADYVFIVEGEKDVDNLRKIGLTATCNTFGAGKWTAELAQYFNEHQHITIIPDNDEPGRKHALQVADALHGKVASLKILELEGLSDKSDVSDWLQGRDSEGAAEELCRLAEAAPEWKPTAEQKEQSQTDGFILYDSGRMEEWPQEPLIWLCEPLIPKGGIGFMSAPPKDRKSLLTLDLALHLAQPEPRLWLGKFKVTPAKVLYIAREDPLRRVKERALEICQSYKMPTPEPGRLQFLIRDRIHLTEPEHRTWLIHTIQTGGFELLILDVINRMHPDLDEISAKDMGTLVSILETLNRDLGITILADDHTRKPQGRNTARDQQEPNPFDMKGSIAKYGCADFMICLARTPQDNRMQIYCENKDSDERPNFFVDVSGKGSIEPKFTWAGDVTKLAGDMKIVGEQNRDKVFEAYGSNGEWRSRKDIAEQLSMSVSTVAKHTGDLVNAGKLQQRGSGRNRQYRQSSEQDESMPRTNSYKGLYDNN